LVNFPGQGLYIWGQKTLYAADTALDRVNVGRLLAYLRKQFDIIARPFIFEPNDQKTRDRIISVFNGFLADLYSKRAVYDFLVVCDSTNNTPARIDRNELYIDVAIEPVKAAEFIYIPVRVVNTGAIAGGTK
jgi:phage tail sheath protein FI